MVNKTKSETVAKINEMLLAGWSIRLVELATGVSKVTIGRYALALNRPDIISDFSEHKCKLKRRKKYLNCGYCNKRFLDKNGEKTSDLKRGRIKRAFCAHRCAMNYRSKLRNEDKCKRCGTTRGKLAVWKTPGYEASGVCFVRGCCPRCYALMIQYNKDENLIKTHELTQQLKGELNYDIERKKYRRPSQSSTGSNRRSTKGQSRSSSGSGDFGSFFSHIAVS